MKVASYVACVIVQLQACLILSYCCINDLFAAVLFHFLQVQDTFSEAVQHNKVAKESVRYNNEKLHRQSYHNLQHIGKETWEMVMLCRPELT